MIFSAESQAGGLEKMCYYNDRHNQLRNIHHLRGLEE